MLFLTKENELQIQEKYVCLYFYAPWMPYHSRMTMMISKMEQKYKDVTFYAIDVDFFKNLCKRFEVDSIPTIVILNNIKEFKRVEGVILTSVIKKIFVDIFK